MALAPSLASTSVASPPTGLRKNCLSVIENVAQALGTMAPTGGVAAIVPLLIMKIGTGTWFVFILILIIFFFISTSISYFASRCISAGSLATFVHLGLGTAWGVIAGWSYIAAMAYSAGSAGMCSAYYLDLLVTQMAGTSFDFPRLVLLTLLVGGLAWWTAHRDIKLSTDFMLYVECASISLITLLLLMIMFSTKAWVDHAQIHLTGFHPLDLQPGLVLAFTALAGFESVSSLSEESRNALRTVPRVMLACAMPVGFFYLLVTYAFVSLMHKGVLSTDDLSSPFLIIAQKLHLPILGIVGSVGIALSFFTCALASINAAARTLFSMSKDGHFWPQFGAVHPRNASPYKAVALVAIFSGAPSVGLLLCGIPTESVIDYLSELGCTGFVISYLLVCLAAPFFLRKNDLLGPREISIAVLSLGCLLMVLGFNLFPIQPAPYCYFIFIFCGTVVLAASTAFLQPAGSANRSLPEVAPYASGKVLDPSD